MDMLKHIENVCVATLFRCCDSQILHYWSFCIFISSATLKGALKVHSRYKNGIPPLDLLKAKDFEPTDFGSYEFAVENVSRNTFSGVDNPLTLTGKEVHFLLACLITRKPEDP